MNRSTQNNSRQAEFSTLFPGWSLVQIWQNPLNPNSLRLTTTAYGVLSRMPDQKNYAYKLKTAMTNRMLLQLDQLITAPYYIGSRKQIQLFGEADAIMLELHGGNLAQYLEDLSNG